jgi:arylformamidase
MPGSGQIDAAFLETCRLPAGVSRLLFRTRNSSEWLQPTREFKRDFAAVTADGADWLVKRRIRLVGVDYLSVEPFGQDGTTHRTLLGAGVVVIEGLDLSAASAGQWDLVCLPLRLRGAEGAPCRVVIRRRETRG